MDNNKIVNLLNLDIFIVLKNAKPKKAFDKPIFNDIDKSTTNLLYSRISSFAREYPED
ncbi:MAG: hypothetical protein HeimC3_53040 [Candidatus Heimdallarchaeota archaeon LC_3]|nr:MAG: hypothetical protein HeimC3_53040 [Candidatus Heimdallarchaeota archaeon LC_3]